MGFIQRFGEALYQRGLLAEEAIPWLCYAFQRRLLSFGTHLLLFGLGCWWAGPWEAFLFLFSFFLLRRRAGGYHAKTPWRCLLLSAAQVGLALKVLLPLLLAAPRLCSWAVLLAAAGAIAATAPLLPRQLHATAAEAAACRSRTLWVLALECAAALGLAVWASRAWFLSVVLGMVGTAVSLLFEQSQRRNDHEQLETGTAAAGGEARQ